MNSPAYGSTRKRHALHPPIAIPHTLSETSAPRFTPSAYPAYADMSVHEGQAAMGERIIVGGRVLDEDGRPVRGAMLEIWQANAAGRYHHVRDQHDAPLDPHFAGSARVFPMKRAAGRSPPSSPVPTLGATTSTPGGPTTFTSRCLATTSPAA
jgi:protocatechuate 3,4-dioxygenase beta subunit